MEKPKSIRLLLDTCGPRMGSNHIRNTCHVAAALGLCFAFFGILSVHTMTPPLHSAEFPRIDFPRASQAGRMPCNGYAPEILSWKSQDGWISARKGKIPEEDLQNHLASVAESHQKFHVTPQIKVRIDSNQPARHFIHLTRCMEKAGLSHLHISVFEPDSDPL